MTASYLSGSATGSFTRFFFRFTLWDFKLVNKFVMVISIIKFKLFKWFTYWFTYGTSSWVTTAQTASYITSSNIFGVITAYSASWRHLQSAQVIVDLFEQFLLHGKVSH